MTSTPSRPSGAVVVSRTIQVPPADVWAVLADGWSYATFVVGASRVRGVDDTWPAVGARIHHSFGLWPAVVDDTTEALESEAPQRLVLQARGWPAGEARVVFTLTEESPGTCTVRIAEDAVKGPGKLVPQIVRQALIGPRNIETLKRLAYLAEGRGRSTVTAP
jgi:uncharacterized protein YndB with AHSA1/START domain